MKKYIIFIVSFLTVGAAIYSCSVKEGIYVPAEPEDTSSPLFFFDPNTIKSFPLTDESEDITVKLNRRNTSEAVTATVAITDTTKLIYSEGIGEIEVVFDAEAETADIVIPVDPSKFEPSKKYGLDIAISAGATPYGGNGLSIVFVGPEAPKEWVKLKGKAKFRESMVAPMYQMDAVEYELDIWMSDEGYYKLESPYGDKFPYNANNPDAKYDPAKEAENFFYVHAENPDAVWIPITTYSLDWGYGSMSIGSLAGYAIAQGSTVEDQKTAGNTGWLKDKIITMPKGKMIYGDDDGLYYADQAGKFRIALPGAILGDYTLSVEYTGLYSKLDGTLFAMFDVNFVGKDVETAKVALVPGKNPQPGIDIIIPSGDEETEEGGASEEGEEPAGPVVIELKASGEARIALEPNSFYTVVVVPFAEGEAQPEFIAYETFLVGEPDPLTIDDYSAADFVGPLSAEALTDKTYDVYAIALGKEGWGSEVEYQLSTQFTDLGQDYYSLPGLGVGGYYQYDDSVVFDLYNGLIYSHKADYQESAIPQLAGLGFIPEFYASNVDSFYSLNYALIGAYVAEGLIALVGYPQYSNDYGINFDGILFNVYQLAEEEGEEDKLYTTVAGYRSILLADPDIYPTPDEAVAAASASKNLKKFAKGTKSIDAKKNCVEIEPEHKVRATYQVVPSERSKMTFKKAQSPAIL